MVRMLSYSTHVEVNAPVDKVFNYLGDLTRNPEWVGGGIESVEKTSEGTVGVGSTFTAVGRQTVGGMYGGSEHTYRANIVVTEYIPNERIAFEGQSRGMHAHNFIELQPSGSGTRVTMGTVVSASALWLPVTPLIYMVVLVGWPLIRWLESRRLRRLKERLEALW